MLDADIIRPDALAADDRRAWQALRRSTPAFASPLLSPEFAEAVAEVRGDAMVAVLRFDGRPVGFLPHHRRPGAFGRPLGAPFSDVQALIAEPWVDAAEALSVTGLARFSFTGLIDPHRAFDTEDLAERAVASSYAIHLDGTAEAYLEARRAASPKRFKNIRRLDHKLDREVGPVRLIAGDTDRGHFGQLIAWKREQFRRTGLHDVLGSTWTQALMDSLFDRKDGDFRSLMLTLMVGDKVAAVHFGVREGARYHPWLAAVDPALSAWSPGQVFFWRAIEAMPDLALTHYDLSSGHDHYKLPFASDVSEVVSGVWSRGAGLKAQGWSLAERAVGPVRAASLGRVRRRLDNIATTELSLGGRVQGLAYALASQGRRNTDMARHTETGA